jgi:hypothetical protein
MEVPLMNGPVDPAAATAAAAAAAAEDDWARWAQQQARAMLSGTHSGLAVHASQQQVPAGGVLGTSAGTGNGRLLVQQQQVRLSQAAGSQTLRFKVCSCAAHSPLQQLHRWVF